ncbi:MAG: hypothetical protein HQL31_10955 [Planctomycetes bacterium]|nr:hypothetical protein [Planctomycetota bacterium]
MSDDVLVVGMPAGSLADPNRGGNLVSFLEDAGFKTSGYQSGGPTSFSTASYIVGWDGRPQEFGSQLGLGELDVAIAGDDWIRERCIELDVEYGVKIELERVLPLKRGGVRIVVIAPGDCAKESPEDFIRRQLKDKKILTVVSEMPYLALNWTREILARIGCGEEFANYSVQKYRTPPKIESGVLIYETWGKTESKVKNGGADFGIEITQSGSAIRSYGLAIIDTIMESESSIWINPDLRRTESKRELLQLFLLNLYGAINAENKVMILFNVANDKAAEIERYLQEYNLFADEPTVNRGRDFMEYSIQMEVQDRRRPLARVRYELARLGARSINTLPIDSSIPGIEILDA